VAIPLISGSVPAAAALSNGEGTPIVELRAGDPVLVASVREADSEVEGGMVAVGVGRKGKRVEYRCADCGYGIVVSGQAPSCPMCSEARWEHVGWRPFIFGCSTTLPPKPVTSPPRAFLGKGRVSRSTASAKSGVGTERVEAGGGVRVAGQGRR
jgi:hypothetical protein